MKRFAAAALVASVLSAGAARAGPFDPPGRYSGVANANYNFAYSYPTAAGRIPALKARLDKEAAAEQKDIASEAKDARAEAKENGSPFNPYDSTTEWQVVTDLPGWLSLSGFSSRYEGGAHPQHEPTALLWDKAKNREVKATDLFVSKAALSKAILSPFCESLNRERAKKRGAPVDPKSKDPFDTCFDPAGSVVILGSADHAHFTRIGILMGPYEAGPYVEGDYEVTLPVTPAVLAIVRPEYRNAFAPAPVGAKK
jgi:hypothetical protein